jgi:hypothetical protein
MIDQAFYVPIRRTAVASAWPVTCRRRAEIHSSKGAAKARGWHRREPLKPLGSAANCARFCGSGRRSGIRD